MQDMDRPETPAEGMRGSAVRGGVAIVAARLGIQFIRLALTAVLARILSPEDYGLVSVVLAVSGLGMVLQDLGLSASTIQREKISAQQISVLFWLNATLGLLIAATGVLCSPLIATFFARPEIESISMALFAGMLIPSLSVQHRALLQRQMRFTEQSVISVIAIVLAGASAIAVALNDGGPWALVALIIVNDLITLVLSWRASGFMPGPYRWDAEAYSMVRFGGGFLMFRLMGYLAQNLHVVLIGRTTGISAAGLFTRAQSTANLLLGYTNEPAGKIAMAALPKHNNAPEAFARFYNRCLAVMMFTGAPIACFTWMFAGDLIRILMGPQWDTAAALLSVLAIGMAVQPALNSTGWIYLARAEIRNMVLWGLIGWGVMIAAALVGLLWGIYGVAWAWTLSLYALLIPCLLAAFRGTQIRLMASMLIVIKPLAAAVIALALTSPLRNALVDLPAVVRLVACGTLFGLGYLGLVWWVFGQKELIVDIFHSLRNKRSSVEAVS
ncbi:MAG: lipopolysaccharide biosynthesis protein [Pseudomonadota bacterium]|nr:lipopolysaccharide biosynthesis protein [Pseudomonadota bacterium]